MLPMGVGEDVLSTGNTHGCEEQEEEMPVFEKHDQLLHGKVISHKMVSSSFMRKYIHLARSLHPVLTREACDLISTEYAKLRAQEMAGSSRAKTQPVTARTLETLIRFSTAHAKARMSKRVELVRISRQSLSLFHTVICFTCAVICCGCGVQADAELAIELINFAYFKKVSGRRVCLLMWCDAVLSSACPISHFIDLQVTSHK